MEISKRSKENFMTETTQFKEVEDLHYFLMNVLNLILFKDYFSCFCEKFEKIKKSVLFAGYQQFLKILKRNLIITWRISFFKGLSCEAGTLFG